MAERIIAAAGGSLKGKKVAVLGLTFKPNTDDMREAPSLDIIPALLEAGATVCAYDPEGMDEAEKLLPEISRAQTPYETMKDADLIALLTEWNQFRALDLDQVKNLLKQPIIVDLRNVYNVKDMVEAGFDYYSIGRAPGYGFSKTKKDRPV